MNWDGNRKTEITLVEKQERFHMLPNTFWMILDDSYKSFSA